MSDCEVSAEPPGPATPGPATPGPATPRGPVARRGGGVRLALALLVGWIALRAAWRGWPLLVAPTTDEVCARLLAAEPPRPPGGAASAITHAECVALVERRLQRRGALAGAALRHCLGTATSVEIAVMCR